MGFAMTIQSQFIISRFSSYHEKPWLDADHRRNPSPVQCFNLRLMNDQLIRTSLFSVEFWVKLLDHIYGCIDPSVDESLDSWANRLL